MKNLTLMIIGCLVVAACGETRENLSDNTQEVHTDKIATHDEVVALLDKYGLEYVENPNPEQEEFTETVGQWEEKIKHWAHLKDEFEKNNPDANKPLTDAQIELMEFYGKASKVKDPVERATLIVKNKEFFLKRGDYADFIKHHEKYLESRGITPTYEK